MIVSKLPRSALAGIVVLGGLSSVAVAETSDGLAPGYYADPMFFIDRSMPVDMRPHDPRPNRLAPERAQAPSHAKALYRASNASETAARNAVDAPARNRELEYFPDSHTDLDYFPRDSGVSHFPDTK